MFFLIYRFLTFFDDVKILIFLLTLYSATHDILALCKIHALRVLK